MLLQRPKLRRPQGQKRRRHSCLRTRRSSKRKMTTSTTRSRATTLLYTRRNSLLSRFTSRNLIQSPFSSQRPSTSQSTSRSPSTSPSPSTSQFTNRRLPRSRCTSLTLSSRSIHGTTTPFSRSHHIIHTLLPLPRSIVINYPSKLFPLFVSTVAINSFSNG